MLRSLSGRASHLLLTSCLFEREQLTEAKSLRKLPPGCVEGSCAEESDQSHQNARSLFGEECQVSSHISLVAGEIFVGVNQKNKLYLKFLHLIKEITFTDDHLYKYISIEGFCGVKYLSKYFPWTKISPAMNEMREWNF